MSDTICVTLTAVKPNELGLVICKSCNEVIATLPTDGYKKFYVLCKACQDPNKEAS
ncbi:GapA-binding peptide SR1P [Paenibacillus sp. GCM10023248]|uniref:GapA-binding peptide SR1P n=1 Tax=unclassified Paenibacillus TaxID=185978 RepID=UPI0023791FBC|nr:GapA-binding peptide SR1P [Paenibacillus sp. MAHUQ-63]MDD9267327.1 GapA-binding peptide SR1P [Paenibacillus sp. MAHUQ-63]